MSTENAQAISLPHFLTGNVGAIPKGHPTRHEVQAAEIAKLDAWRAEEARQHAPWWMPRPWRSGER